MNLKCFLIFFILFLYTEMSSQTSKFKDAIKNPIHYTPNFYPETYDQLGYTKLLDSLIRWEMTRSMYDWNFSAALGQINTLSKITTSEYGMAMYHYLEGIRKGLADPLNAETNFLRALDYFEAKKDTSGILHTTLHLLRLNLNNTMVELAEIKRYQNKYEAALLLGEKATEPFDQIIFFRIKILFDEFMDNQKDVAYFQEYINKGFNLVKSMPSTYNYYKFLMLNAIGIIHSKNIKTVESEKYHLQAYEYIKNTKSPDITMTLYRISVMQYCNGKYDEALSTLNKAEDRPGYLDDKEILSLYCKQKGFIYSKKGNFQKAETFFQISFDHYIQTYTKSRHLLYMKDMAAFYKLEKNIETLTNYEKRQANLNLIIVIVVAILSIAIIYSRLKINANKILQQEIKKKDFIYSMIGHDLSSPIVAMDNTLNHIEMSLNDSLTIMQKNYISQLKSEISGAHYLLLSLLHWYKSDIALFSNKLGKTTSSIKNNIDQSVQHLFLKTSEMSVAFVNKCEDHVMFSLNVDMFKTIIRNIVDNAVKHSECTQVTIDAIIKNGKLIVTIHDNGQGMEPKYVQSFNESQTIYDMNSSEIKIGLGTIFILEFAKSMNSTIKITSDKEGSTYYWEINA